MLGNASALPNEDSDGDLLSNLSEFATGSDPTAPTADPWPAGQMVHSGSPEFHFQFERLRGGVEIALGHYEVGDLTYWIEISPSLGANGEWQILTDTQAVAADSVDIGGGMERTDYRLTSAAMSSGQQQFVRLRIELEPAP